jgi:hypothetical protein
MIVDDGLGAANEDDDGLATADEDDGWRQESVETNHMVD